MQTIHVSPDFPLNRRMRKAVRRGKLEVVREGEEKSAIGWGVGGGGGFSRKTIHSLAQFLGVLSEDIAKMLLSKHKIIGSVDETRLSPQGILEHLQSRQGDVRDLIREIGVTKGAVRHESYPKYKFDNRFADLENHLKLDGFRFRAEGDDYPQDGELISVDPAIQGTNLAPVDMLVHEIERSNRLDEEAKNSVKGALNESTENFMRGNHTACLSSARVALDVLAKGISKKGKWGEALHQMAECGLITGRGRREKNSDEACLSELYGWVSDTASHNHLSDEEKALFGRRIILSMCLFLIRVANLRD